MSSLTFSPVHRFCAGISLAGFVVLGWVLFTADSLVRPGSGLLVALLVPAVVLGELQPLKIPRRGDNEEVTIGTAFAFALLVVAGLPVVLLAQALASAGQDLWARKPLWRVSFNVGQYCLAWAAADVPVRLLMDGGSAMGFGPDQLVAAAASAMTFFLLNTSVVGAAIALHQRTPILRYFRSDLQFSFFTSVVLLSFGPVLLAALEASPLLYPACVLPVLAVWHGGRQAVRSDYQANHDALTGLPNRPRLQELIERAIAEREPFAVMLMDLDRFKEINDTLGHHHGALLLEQVAARLVSAVRERDTVARLGGDEFVVLVAETPDRDAAEHVAARIREAFELPFRLGDLTLEVEASIGIAWYPDDAADGDALLQRADIAMYHAKRSHISHAAYSPDYDHHSPARLALAADLRRALHAQEIVPWYQPLVALDRDEVAGVEALARWQHPTLGLLAPSAFIDVAERTGLIRELTLVVLELALADRNAWAHKGLDLVLNVNVSARNLLDRDFPADVAERLTAAGTTAHRLTLEITESTIMADPATATAVLAELAGMGIALAIDDYGTGYSSLAYLKQLPVGELKIDRSFVIDMGGDRDNALIVRSTIELGHNLGLRVVAEGVEDRLTLDTLRQYGCDGAQGHHLSPPVPAERVPAAISIVAAALAAPLQAPRPLSGVS
jgi:diguanylate cyclase (GGDEF)-like protein